MRPSLAPAPDGDGGPAHYSRRTLSRAAPPPIWNHRAAWYDPAAFDAEFILVDPFRAQNVNLAAARRAYGEPEAQYPVAGQEILVYRANLLTAVRFR